MPTLLLLLAGLLSPLFASAPPPPAEAPPSPTEASPLRSASPGLYVPARRWALVIGAKGYVHLGALRYADADAKRFAQTLTDRFGFDPSTIRLMTDGAEDPDLRPTAGNMFLQLRRILADGRLRKTDLFVFYFAGHGTGTEQGDYLLPLDGALETVTDVGLHVADVVEELTRAGMNNVLFLVDGCRTGSKNTFGRELWELAERSRLAVVLGCEPGQQSFEDARLGGGVFTTHLVEALEAPALIDADSGALWASRVAVRVRELVGQWTARGFDGRQVPQIWADPTRDVLLGATLPARADLVVSSFRSTAERLDPAHYQAAAARYAEELYTAERYEEAAALLKAAEQMGELRPHLLYLMADCLQHTGRNAEMVRVLAELRERHPDSFFTLVAVAHDLSGETPAPARYLAAKELWDKWPIESPDLALLVAFNLVTGGPPREARAVLDEMLPHFAAGGRPAAYATYMSLLLDGRTDEALATLERAEGLPGDYPDNHRLRYEGLQVLLDRGRRAEARTMLDRWLAEESHEGSWWVQRAWLRHGAEDWDGAFADAARALEEELEPWALLLAVRAAGTDGPRLAAGVGERAARHPLSWQAALAAALVTGGSREAHQAALDRAKTLAPGLGPWTATVARARYDLAYEALTRGLIDGVAFAHQRYELLGPARGTGSWPSSSTSTSGRPSPTGTCRARSSRRSPSPISTPVGTRRSAPRRPSRRRDRSSPLTWRGSRPRTSRARGKTTRRGSVARSSPRPVPTCSPPRARCGRASRPAPGTRKPPPSSPPPRRRTTTWPARSSPSPTKPAARPPPPMPSGDRCSNPRGRASSSPRPRAGSPTPPAKRTPRSGRPSPSPRAATRWATPSPASSASPRNPAPTPSAARRSSPSSTGRASSPPPTPRSS